MEKMDVPLIGCFHLGQVGGSHKQEYFRLLSSWMLHHVVWGSRPTFRGFCYLHQRLPWLGLLEIVRASATSVGFYQTTWCHIPEDNSHLHKTSDFMKLFYYHEVLMVYYMKDYLDLESHIVMETGYISISKVQPTRCKVFLIYLFL